MQGFHAIYMLGFRQRRDLDPRREGGEGDKRK